MKRRSFQPFKAPVLSKTVQKMPLKYSLKTSLCCYQTLVAKKAFMVNFWQNDIPKFGASTRQLVKNKLE